MVYQEISVFDFAHFAHDRAIDIRAFFVIVVTGTRRRNLKGDLWQDQEKTHRILLLTI